MKKIYMIAGKARHGKDTIGGYIKEYYLKKGFKTIILQISSPLKYYASKALDWDGSEETKPRTFLQEVGTIIRSDIDEKFFTNRLIEDIKILGNYCDVIVITDVRLPLEFNEVSNSFQNVKKVFVERSNFESDLSKVEKKHAIENSLSDYHDYDIYIKNDGNLNQLKSKIESILEEDV